MQYQISTPRRECVGRITLTANEASKLASAARIANYRRLRNDWFWGRVTLGRVFAALDLLTAEEKALVDLPR